MTPAMVRGSIACALTLLPLLALACESGDRRRCQEEFRTLISYRTEAIEGAFGDVFSVLPAQIRIRFVKTQDPDYAVFGGRMAYDIEHGTLILPRRVLSAKTPNPLRSTVYYWPFYEYERYREEYPIIGAIDTMLWSAYLQEAARSAGLPWPHKDCSSVNVAKRLPCEMLLNGALEHVTSLRSPLFNSNRIDLIWPEDFGTMRKRVWRTDQEYRDVQHYGGILLVQPLVNEFGVPRAFAYIAQTPFQVEDNNLRQSATHYQDRAREVLTQRVANKEPLLSTRTAYAPGASASSDRDRARSVATLPRSDTTTTLPRFQLQASD
jgi:hypothetical protein